MSHPDLVALLRGGLSNADALDAGAHLEECATCRAELAELSVGHAMLLSAVRTTGPTGARAVPLPELRVDPGHPARRRRVLAAVAAVVVLLAGATAVGLLLGGPEDDGTPTPYAGVRLEPVQGSGSGTVSMVEDGSHTRMTVTTTGLPETGSRRYYYAWLLDPETNKMLPLGQVDADGTTSFDLDRRLVAAYAAVDISAETDDGDPAHSPVSVLRGGYETP